MYLCTALHQPQPPTPSSEKIDRGQATLGQFDGQHMALACGTLAGKVFIHNPHQHGVSETNVSYLNINKRITALTSGNLSPNRTDARDVLLVGTATSLQCYDIDRYASWKCAKCAFGKCVTLEGIRLYILPLYTMPSFLLFPLWIGTCVSRPKQAQHSSFLV